MPLQRRTSMKACIASASYDLTVRVWDIKSRTQIITIAHPESQINCLSFVPNGGPDVDHIAIGSWQKLKVFDITQTTQPVICPSFEGASKNITSCGFSLPNVHGSWMFTGGDDGHVRIFDTKPIIQRQNIQPTALTCHNALEIGSPITSVVLHLNQIELFIADQSGRVHIWDLSKQVNMDLHTPKLGMFEFVVKLAVHPVVTSTGTILSGITNRGRLLSWRLAQHEIPMNISGYDVDPMDLKTTTNATFLGIASLNTERKKNRVGLGVSYTRDGQYLVATFADSDVNWYNSDDFPNYDNHPNLHFNTGSDWNWDTVVTSDNKFMFTGGSDGRIKIWEVETQQMLFKMEGHQKGISAMTISDSP